MTLCQVLLKSALDERGASRGFCSVVARLRNLRSRTRRDD